MSCTNCSWVTCSGASSDEWQSTQVLCVAARAVPIATTKAARIPIPLMGDMSINRHSCYVCQGKNAQPRYPAPGSVRPVQERQHEPNDCRGAEYQNPEDFPVHEA